MDAEQDDRRRLILATARNPNNLEALRQVLEPSGFRIATASAPEGFEAALSAKEIDLALLDVTGFGPEIWDLCRQLQKREVPFLIVSGRHGPVSQQEGLLHGARGVMVKPVVVRELLNAIQLLLGA